MLNKNSKERLIIVVIEHKFKITIMSKLNLMDGEGNGTPLQLSCLEHPMDGGAWLAAVHGVTQSPTQLKQLSSKFNG